MESNILGAEKFLNAPLPTTPFFTAHTYFFAKGGNSVNKNLCHSYLEPKFVMLRPLPTSNALKSGILPDIHLNILESQEMRCFS